MTTPTTNYGWQMPVDGGDFDNWGVELNTVIQAIDTQVKTNDTNAQGYANTAQGASLQKANNLSDLASLATAWANLGVGITTNANGSYIQIGPLLVQWGNIAASNNTFSFPRAFSSTTGLVVVPGNSDTMGADNDVAYIAKSSLTTTSFFAATKSASGSGTTGYGVAWLAIGPA